MQNPPLRPDLLLLGLGPVFLAFVIGENLIFAKRHPQRFDKKDTLNNILLAALQQGSELFFFWINWMFVTSAYKFLFEHGLGLVPQTISWVWFVVLFLLQDFLFYWFHRASHRCRWFWSAHVAHHSSEFMNFSTALRQSVLYPVLGNWAFYLPLAYLGFSPPWIAFIVAINLAFQFFIHTQAVGRLGVLELFLNTPNHHRVHHARNKKYVDKNYAGVLIIWDKLFRTFIEEGEACEFGITKKINYRHPIESNFREMLSMWQDVRLEKSFKNKFKRLFYPPEWDG